MSSFTPKTYQSQVLESITAYFESCHEQRSPSLAFTATTERLWGRGLAYNPLSGFSSDMPYFCLRVPTRGGQTWLAAKSVALVNRQLLRCEHRVILWLVPSKLIREQTPRPEGSPTSLPRGLARSRAGHGDGSRRGQERHPCDDGHRNLDHRRYAAGVSG